MEILTVGAGMRREKTWAGKPVHRNLRDRPRGRSSVRLLVRVVAGTYHRSRLNMAKPEAESLVSQINKLVRRVEPRDREMIFRGAQVLADRQDVDAACPEIAEHFDQFFARFAQADHYP